MYVNLFALAAFATGALAAKCKSSDTLYNTLTAPLVQEAAYMTNASEPITVAGTVSIVDGCTFKISNFTFLPGYGSVMWYGRKGTNGDTGVRVSDSIVSSANGAEQTFTLTQTTGSAVSFADFDVLSLFSVEKNFEFATASIDTASLAATKTATDKAKTTDENSGAADYAAYSVSAAAACVFITGALMMC